MPIDTGVDDDGDEQQEEEHHGWDSVDSTATARTKGLSGRGFGAASEIARWQLSGMFEQTSLVVCKLYRDAGWWKIFVIGDQIGGRSIVDFFFTDTYGDMAELRDEFKSVARIKYSDAHFFKVCAERASYGQLSATKS